MRGMFKNMSCLNANDPVVLSPREWDAAVRVVCIAVVKALSINVFKLINPLSPTACES